MPKIIINEHDMTTSPLGAYANFAVVVPGLVAAGKALNGVFDDNGVYECQSTADFEEKIGKVAACVTTSAFSFTNPNFVEIQPLAMEPSEIDTEAISASIAAGNEVYYCVEIPKANLESMEKKSTRAFYIENELIESDTKYRIYEKIGTGTRASTYCIGYVENPSFIIATADEVVSMGNQIAYELLNMGYPVLYKAINDVATADGVATEISGAEIVRKLQSSDFWAPLRDKANYDFRYVLSGGCADETVAANMANLATFVNNNKANAADDYLNNTAKFYATGRGDCIALIDINEGNLTDKKSLAQIVTDVNKSTANIVNKVNSDSLGTNAALFMPKVTYAGDAEKIDTYQNLTFPASFHYLACAKKSFETFAEWFAVAGYTRGVSNKTVVGTSVKLGDYAANYLQPRVGVAGGTEYAVNLVVNVRNTYYLWGNRTAAKLDSEGLKAKHFLNIRQLCTTIKKELYNSCRTFTFDPNSSILWINFCARIRPLLDTMKSNQGINDYKIIRVNTGAKAVLSAKIRIVPIEAVEDFEIDISLEDSLAGVTAEISD